MFLSEMYVRGEDGRSKDIVIETSGEGAIDAYFAGGVD